MYKFINRQTFNADKRVLPNRVLGNWSVLSFSYPLGCFCFFFYYYYFIFASQIGRKLVDVKRSRTGRIEFLGRLRHPPPRIRFLGSNRQKNWLQSLNYFILELSFEPNQMVSFFFVVVSDYVTLWIYFTMGAVLIRQTRLKMNNVDGTVANIVLLL